MTEHDWSRFPSSVRRKSERIRRRYSLLRRTERLLGINRRSLANDALRVVLEWGPQARLSEAWRLRQRQPGEPLSRLDETLAAAHAVEHEAYELTAAAWPRDRREISSEVNRVAARAREVLAEWHSDLEPTLLNQAVHQANLIHMRG